MSASERSEPRDRMRRIEPQVCYRAVTVGIDVIAAAKFPRKSTAASTTRSSTAFPNKSNSRTP